MTTDIAALRALLQTQYSENTVFVKRSDLRDALSELEAARAVVEAAKLLANLEGDPLAYFNSMTEALAAYEEACNG